MHGYNCTERWQILPGCILLGQFKPLLALSMPVDPVLVITTPQQNQQNWLVIYTFNILSSIFLANIQALQAQLEQLRLCWVCQWVGDHQESSSMCIQERHGGRTAARSGSSWQHEQPDVRGLRATGWKDLVPMSGAFLPPCLRSIWNCEAWGGLQLLPQCQGCGGKPVHRPWDTHRDCAHVTHTALTTVLTLVLVQQLQQFISTWIYLQYLDRRHTWGTPLFQLRFSRT